MQMFHLQTMNLISYYHCPLMGRESGRECVCRRGGGVGGCRDRAKIIINSSMQTQYLDNGQSYTRSTFEYHRLITIMPHMDMKYKSYQRITRKVINAL